MAHPYEMVTSLLGGFTTPSSIIATLPTDPTVVSPWIAFLHRDEHLDEFTQRNAFLSHLIDGNPSSESYALLARLVQLHSDHAAAMGKKWRGEDNVALFGSDFVQRIAPYLASHFHEEGSVSLLRALLRPNRPRNEVAADTIHSLILLPLSTSHPTALAEVVLQSVVWTVMQITDGDKEEVDMKRETAALGKLQDLREVIEIIAKYCVECFRGYDDEEGNRIVKAFEGVHHVAAYALESQLETLLDEDASCILDKFNSNDDKEQNESNQDTVNGISMDTEEVVVELPPLYESLTAGPLNLSPSQLVETLDTIHDKLSITESERWDERLAALVDLERILASSSLEGESRSVFIEKLRKMAVPEQFADLRSQVTHAACRVLLCTSFEYRNFIEEDSSLVKPLQQFVEYCLPALLKLCTSGTRLMSAQGVGCVQSICVTSVGHPRILTMLCEDIVDKKSKNNNRRRAAVMGLTAALRVWDESCIKNVELISNAVKAANSDRDPGVREEGRKAYWAMQSCDKTRSKAEEMYAERSREYRNLVKIRSDIDLEWDEEGRLCYLLNTGVLLEEDKNKAASTGTGRPSTAPSRVNSNKRSAVVKDRTTPAKKAGRFTTHTPEVTGSSPQRPLSAKLARNTPSTKLPMDTPASRRTTFAPSSTKTSGSKTESIKPERKSMAAVNTQQIDSSSKMKRGIPAQSTLISVAYNEKENSPTTPISQSSPKVGSPIVSTLARPSPLSIEKCRSRNALNQVVTMLSDTNNPSEQYLGIQVLALFAKDHSEHESWDKMFGVVLELLIGGCFCLYFFAYHRLPPILRMFNDSSFYLYCRTGQKHPDKML